MTELTIFEASDSGEPIVCYSGSIDSFNAVGKNKTKLIEYRDRLLKRHVQNVIIYNEKLFIWIDNEISFDHNNENKAKLDKLADLLQEGRCAYLKADRIQNRIFILLEKMGVSNPANNPVSLPEVNNLTDAITYQLKVNDRYLDAIMDTVDKVTR